MRKELRLCKSLADSDNADKFISLVRRYTNFEELTPAMINELVERVEVHEGEWVGADPATGYRGMRWTLLSAVTSIFCKWIFSAPKG
jgi:hypothetical protein